MNRKVKIPNKAFPKAFPKLLYYWNKGCERHSISCSWSVCAVDLWYPGCIHGVRAELGLQPWSPAELFQGFTHLEIPGVTLSRSCKWCAGSWSWPFSICSSLLKALKRSFKNECRERVVFLWKWVQYILQEWYGLQKGERENMCDHEWNWLWNNLS